MADGDSKAEQIDAGLDAAKLREAEQASALEIAETALQRAIDHMVKNGYGSPSFRDYLRQSITIAPSAALAERDRGIREECIQTYHAVYSDMVHSGIPFHITGDFFPAVERAIREFGLEPKTEGVAAFFGTWPGDETDKELGDAAKEVK